MALVKLGFGIQDIRGKVGGSVFAGTRAGLVLKNKTSKNQFKEKVKTNVKNYMSANNNSWADLTELQRISWQSYSNIIKIGQKRNPDFFITGRQLFIQYNQYRLLYNLNPLLIPEFNDFSVVPVTFSVDLIGGNLLLLTDRPMVPADEFITMAITIPVRHTLNNPGSRLKSIIFSTIASNVHDVSSAYTDVFGILPKSGQTIFFKAKNLSKTEPIASAMFTSKTLLT